MAISDAEVYLLNRFGSIAVKTQLGTLIRNAEQGGLSAGSVTATELASNAVTTVKITDANVTAAKLASDAVTTAKILAANVTLAKLAAGITPSHVVKYAGRFTTAGGDASESISVAGVVATDQVVVSVHTAGGTPRSVVAAAAGTDAIDVTMSGDPSTDHVLTYMVLRAAS
jgi:hypothetical protein